MWKVTGTQKVIAGLIFSSAAFAQQGYYPQQQQQAYVPQQQPYYGQPQQQQQPQQYPPPQDETLSPQQLNNLVAPIALYPDPLLGQVLAASTYPTEIQEAAQWMQQHPELQGEQLVQAARQMNWDASVQALVAFPQALNTLASDIQWTTDLGNAFLAQQTDLMNSIQQMRASAEQNGRLRSTAQQQVINQPPPQQGYGGGYGNQPLPQQAYGGGYGQQAYGGYGQQAPIEIEPTDPNEMYVPYYDPAYVWGPPAVGYYPALNYPSFGIGIYFGPRIFIGGLFNGFLGFGGWGWGLNWFGHSLFVNGAFFGHFGFGGGFYARGGIWAHDPGHRFGVPYANRAVAARFGGSFRGGYSPAVRAGGFSNARGFAGGNAFRGSAQGYSRSYNTPARPGGFAGGGYNAAPRNNFAGGAQQRGFAQQQAPARSYAFNGAGQQHFSAPSRPSGGGFSGGGAQHFSAPHSFGGGGGHSSGGGHGGGGGHHR